MKVEKYQLKSESSLTTFEFISEGPKGLIHKRIEFQRTTDPRLFNLAFGDKNLTTREIDDQAISNNADSEKVLATVVGAVYAFSDKHPNTFIYAKGSTKARTRLYKMGITKYYEEMRRDFFLYGQVGDDFYPFQIDMEYDGFLAQRKFE
ncbi:MAG: hypothetical protein H0U39_06395 [Segetibacter sp.]|nr:hypothetical protein [Segetibacter sp.]